MEKHKRKKRIIQRLSGNAVEEYTTLQAASKSIKGAETTVIKRALDGKMPSAYGYRWKWKTEG